jgi:hypothetical protein
MQTWPAVALAYQNLYGHIYAGRIGTCSLLICSTYMLFSLFVYISCMNKAGRTQLYLQRAMHSYNAFSLNLGLPSNVYRTIAHRYVTAINCHLSARRAARSNTTTDTCYGYCYHSSKKSLTSNRALRPRLPPSAITAPEL